MSIKNIKLTPGDIVKSRNGVTIKVLKELGEGGQGWVYEVDYNGKKKALKWYKPAAFQKDLDTFYGNLRSNIEKGSPAPNFLWPQDMTDVIDGSFGYIMELRPVEYHELNQFLLCKVRFSSYKAVVDAALQIVSAFRILHNKGYAYQDLNDGNFFINPQNGNVLIADNDNVAPEGITTIDGKPRYMAPEIVRGGKPNTLSDRFSMALILYMLFCLNHPLEGKKTCVPYLTDEDQRKFYGFEPLFMFDPTNGENAPNPELHKNSIMLWNSLPDYMRKTFLKAFSQDALLKRPNARPKEIDWLKVLTRFRSNIVRCSCGSEIFVPNACDNPRCGKQAQTHLVLELQDYSIPAVRDSRIYRCQLGVCDAEDALNPIAHVIEKKGAPGVYGIRNKTTLHWDAITTKGEIRKVAPDEVVPVKPGIVLKIENEEIKIKQK